MPKRVSLPVMVPELTAEEQLHADHPESHTSLVGGARVLARWTDKNFYPGHVISRDGLGRYKVKYIDENVRDMPAPDVVPLAMLVPPKLVISIIFSRHLLRQSNNYYFLQCMFALDDEQLQPVEILKSPSADNANEWFAGKFRVMNKTTEKEQTYDSMSSFYDIKYLFFQHSLDKVRH